MAFEERKFGVGTRHPSYTLDIQGEGVFTNYLRQSSESNQEYNDRDVILVQVTDTGKGIPQDQQSDMFKMGKEKQSRKGSGIGLPWAYAFLKSYGGNITFETYKWKGTTMNLFIPQNFGDSLIFITEDM